jgi:hypothetical protein
MSCVTLGFCYSVNLCFGGHKISWFFLSLLRLNGSWNRGLMRRWLKTCSDSTLCHRPVAVCNLKNVTQSVVSLSFAVSSLLLVLSHKFVIIVISTDGKGKLVPFHAIRLEWRYSVTNNNVGTKWEWSISGPRHFTHRWGTHGIHLIGSWVGRFSGWTFWRS